MNIVSINPFRNSINTRNNKLNNTNPIQQENRTTLNTLPKYSYSINFKATNIETNDVHMQKRTDKK